MKKLMTITLVTTLVFTRSLFGDPVEDLKKARASLSEGKENIIKGKQGLIDGYTKIKTDVVEKLNKGASDTQGTVDDVYNNKGKIENLVDKVLPGAIAAATIVTLLFPPAAYLVGESSYITNNLSPLPGVLGNLGTTLQSIVDTLKQVSTTIATANDKLNPQAPTKPAVYVKFEAAEKRFDDALAKIDQIIPKLEKIKAALGS